jgi:hypothetical protein
MEMGWCEQYEVVMYFSEGGRTAWLALLGAVRRHGSWHVLLPKNAPMCRPQGLLDHNTVQRCMKREAKNRLGPAWISMAGDVHSGGQDWHPSAGMRYRLARS